MVLVISFIGIPDPETFRPNRTAFNSEFVPLALNTVIGENIPDPVKEVVAHEYTDWSDPNNLDTIRSKSVQLFSDLIFTSPMLQSVSGHASLAQQFKNTYMYVSSVIPKYRVLQTPTWQKLATHGDEVGYLFFEEDGGAVPRMQGHENFKPEECEKEVAQYFMTLWSNFAKTG